MLPPGSYERMPALSPGVWRRSGDRPWGRDHDITRVFVLNLPRASSSSPSRVVSSSDAVERRDESGGPGLAAARLLAAPPSGSDRRAGAANPARHIPHNLTSALIHLALRLRTLGYSSYRPSRLPASSAPTSRPPPRLDSTPSPASTCELVGGGRCRTPPRGYKTASTVKMPGILPMKVIKVGNGNQSRIAQACDRCRSKKIRCDGIRPCCTQCANVGFECRTSDKLSRRAFPRGYTESLEDRVRCLEAEVRELKGLLDEKDEKIDVLSRMRAFSPQPHKPSSQSPASTDESKSNGQDGGDVIQAQHSASLLRNPTADAPFTGPSSTRSFVGRFTVPLPSNVVSRGG